MKLRSPSGSPVADPVEKERSGQTTSRGKDSVSLKAAGPCKEGYNRKRVRVGRSWSGWRGPLGLFATVVVTEGQLRLWFGGTALVSRCNCPGEARSMPGEGCRVHRGGKERERKKKRRELQVSRGKMSQQPPVSPNPVISQLQTGRVRKAKTPRSDAR